MKKAVEFLFAFSKLVRFPNLLIIVLTQYLLRFSIIEPFLYRSSGASPSSVLDFSILVLVTVLIAAGGYIINDYFDVKIDAVNKPERMIIDRQISARMAIALHLVISGMATVLGLYLAYRVRSLSFGLIFPVLAVLLWFYSASYKRMFLWGNLIVSFLSAFVVLIAWLFEFFYLQTDAEAFAEVLAKMGNITRVFLAYALFAFLVTLVREIIKDMEDWEGDQRYGCRTLPLVIGLPQTRIVAVSLMIINMLLLSYVMVVLYRLHFIWAFWYFLTLVQIPVVYLAIVILKAREKRDFHLASTITKLVMLTGILSMQVISLTF